MSFSFLPSPPAEVPYVTQLRDKLNREIELRRQRERELAQARRDLAQIQTRLHRRLRTVSAGSPA